jgi:hypothetical protein
MQIRIPRPQGLSLQHKKHNNKELKQKLITSYINNNFTLNQRHYTIGQLSTLYMIPIKDIYKRIGEHNNSLNALTTNKEAFTKQLSAIALGQISSSLEDKALIHEQLLLLKRAQGSGYKAFISGELGKTLGLAMQSTKQIADIIKMFSSTGGTGGTTNILIQGLKADEQEGPKGFTADDAVRLLAQREKESLNPIALRNEALYEKHQLGPIPEVSVKLSDEEHIPTTMESLNVGHEDRREDSYEIDSESDGV